MNASENKELVRARFEARARGEGDVYDLLAEDVVWTIPGSSPGAGTYTSRREFLERVVQPLRSRLVRPVQPTLEAIFAEGDHVVVMWHGEAPAVDGVPYINRYCWIMRLEEGKVKEGTAFFDSGVMTDLYNRIPEPPPK